MKPPNHSIQRMEASRSDQSQFLYQRRLAPTADAQRSVHEVRDV
jgi:hypothetical protein